MRHKDNKGFSILELLITVFLFSFVVTGVFSFHTYNLNTSKTIVYKSEIENLHNRFQYLLSKNNYCYPSLASKLHGAKVDIQYFDPDDPKSIDDPVKKKFEDEKFKDLLEKGARLKDISAYPGEKGVGLEKVTLNIDPHFFFKEREYGELIFDYIFRKDGVNTETQSKKIRLYLEIQKNTNNFYEVKTCINYEQEKCPDDVSFLTSFNESSLDVSTEYTLKTSDKKTEGLEYTYKVSNLFDGLVGEYCVSHNICSKGQWISKSICYDSCRNKFWWDGILTYKNNLDSALSSGEKSICKSKKFDFNTSCGSQKIHSVNLKEKNYNETESNLQVFYNNNSNRVGHFEAIFKCSYAGTWILNYAKCMSIDPVKSTYTDLWDISPFNSVPDNNNLLCSSKNKSLSIKSYDKTQTEYIDLGKLYSEKLFHIGEPKRLIINFKDKTSSATIACQGDGGYHQWRQIGESVPNCDVLGNPIPKTDIIFIVDNSGSMGDEQEILKQSIDQFINKFFSESAERINYRIYVGTTDFNLSGYFNKKHYRGRENILKQLLGLALQPGIGGSGHEKPINSALNILKSYQMRSNATLALFMITDEEGSNSEINETNELIHFIDNLKKNDKGKVISRGIINLDEGTEELRHVTQVVNYYSGKVFDIKEQSGYGDQLANFAEEIIEKTLIIGN